MATPRPSCRITQHASHQSDLVSFQGNQLPWGWFLPAMKLSQAITIGLADRSECALQMFELTCSNQPRAITACCTLGAAYIGAFGATRAMNLIDVHKAWQVENEAFIQASMAQLSAKFQVLKDPHAGEQLANAFEMTAHDLAGPGADLGAVIQALNDERAVKAPTITEALAHMGY